MTIYLKTPDGAVDYRIDWGGRAALVAADWTVSPAEPGGLSLRAATVEAAVAHATLAGGHAGRAYRVTGAARFAGTVIWATDLREDRQTSGGGKGKPAVTTYSYSASFAVALSARPIRAVGRIWADGKLLRGAAGDWKTATGFRLHSGDEGQPVDPLIAAAEGAAASPAYRGLAYAVFENLELADFGNRIPSLTFEVEADPGAVALDTIVADLSGGAARASTTATLGGYAANGDSVRGAIEALAAVAPLAVADDGTTLFLGEAAGDPVLLAADELGSRADADRADRREVERAAAGTLPDEVTVAYYEPARDYQAGLQRARRGGPGRRVETIELAAALAATEAKRIAEQRLAAAWAGRARARVTLPWRRIGLRPGTAVALDDSGARYRVAGWALDRMVVRLTLAGMAPASAAGAGAASPGRGVAEPDTALGTTLVELLDLPPLGDAIETTPRLWIAAAGTKPGWRRAALIASRDGGASWDEIGATAAPAIIGRTADALAPGDASLFDARTAIVVALPHDGMWLENRDDGALVGGANLAMIGEELIQFGRAEPLGANRFRLSRLLRGRRGTEAAMAVHAPDERFVLIEQRTLVPYALPLAALGAPVRVLASGVADAVPAEATAIVVGRALRPPAPAHLTARRTSDGTLLFGWTRRSRAGWSWLDGADAPLGEESERYRLVITPSAGRARTVDLTTAAYGYSPADRIADGATAAASVTIAVSQTGTIGASRPATMSFNL
ncbi:MAG TPA: phage tail protein [Sphingomonadaceae bacterium]|nr:phage tail protein [Sphingomonadaceae bacterium]